MAQVAMAPPPPSALRYPHTAQLTGEERALAKYLETEVVTPLVHTRGMEQRIDVYLALNDVCKLQDTDDAVRIFQFYLPFILRAIHDDLQHTTLRDVLRGALRVLAYFMFHPRLAESFTPTLLDSFLTDILSHLASTQDEGTYKLCVWCLASQNVDLTPNDYLTRVIEVLVVAIMNPFKSRLIETDALKGLHRISIKYQKLAIGTESIFRLWFLPLTSRLNSSDRVIRQQTTQVVHVVAQYVAAEEKSLPAGIENHITDVLTDYGLPTIQMHMTYDRHQEALVVWKLVVQLMKRKLTNDWTILNDLLAVTEICMRHHDVGVRLQCMEVWRHLIAMFRYDHEWLFKKGVVVVLVRPLVLSLEEEVMINVLHAAVITWRVLVAALVEDFNKYCESQPESNDAVQQHAKKWRRWVDECLRKVMAVTIDQTAKATEGGVSRSDRKAVVLEEVEATIRDVFQPAVVRPPRPSRDSTEPSASDASVTEMSHSNPQVVADAPRHPVVDRSDEDHLVLDQQVEKISTPPSLTPDATEIIISPPCPPLGRNMLGLGLVHMDVLGLIQVIDQAAATGTDPSNQQRYSELSAHIWEAFCKRLQIDPTNDERPDPAFDKLRGRVLRLTLDFGLGINSSSSNTMSSVDSQATNGIVHALTTDATITAADLINGPPVDRGVADFQSQLRSLLCIFSAASSGEELRKLLQHPRSKIGQQLLTRIDGVIERNDAYRSWLSQWDRSIRRGDGDVGEDGRIDFAHKTNSVLCVGLYLLIRLSVAFDGDNNDSDTIRDVIHLYERVLNVLKTCVEDVTESRPTVGKFCRLVFQSPSTANELLSERTSSGSKANPAELLAMCSRLSDRSEDTQNNVLALLELQRSPVRSPVRPATGNASGTTNDISPATLRTPGSSDGASFSPCLLEPPAVVVHGSNAVTREEALSSPRREVATTDPDPQSTTPRTPSRPRKSALKQPASPSPNSSDQSSTNAGVQTSTTPNDPPIYPELASCTDPITSLFRQFSVSFKQVILFHKLKTVGDLSALPTSRVRAMATDAITTVTRALDAHKARRNRPAGPPTMMQSPFRNLVQSPTSPGITPRTPSSSTSPKRQSKRPLTTPNRLVVPPLPLVSPSPQQDQRKRARRTLSELSSEGEQTAISSASSDASSARSSSSRVVFQLDIGEGETKLSRPGLDSQEGIDVAAKAASVSEESKEQIKEEETTAARGTNEEDDEERLEQQTTRRLKAMHYLQRALYYLEEVSRTEESVPSDASVGTRTTHSVPLMEFVQNGARVLEEITATFDRLRARTENRCDSILERLPKE